MFSTNNSQKFNTAEQPKHAAAATATTTTTTTTTTTMTTTINILLSVNEENQASSNRFPEH